MEADLDRLSLCLAPLGVFHQDADLSGFLHLHQPPSCRVNRRQDLGIASTVGLGMRERQGWRS